MSHSFTLLIAVTLVCAEPSAPQPPSNPSKASTPIEVVKTSWGEMRMFADRVELQVEEVPKDNAIEMPRLNNRVETIHLRGDEKEQPLSLKPGLKTWSISLPPTPPAPIMVIMKTKEAPHLPKTPQIISADEQGDVTLPALASITHGKLLRYEPQPHKNTVGYWANVKDWCEWKLRIDQPGRFAVHVLQGCGKGHGGSEVDVVVGEAKVSFIVEDTGHFQNFNSRRIGEIEIPDAGLHALEIRPQKKAGGAVMDVRQVRLERLEDESP